MAKIYEALEHADLERKVSGLVSEIPLAPPRILENQYIPASAQIHMEEEMLALYKTIDSMLHNTPRKVIQFIGSKEGEGTSTVVREFAKVASKRAGKQVLLLDADRHQPAQHLFFGISPRCSWMEAINNNQRMEDTIYQIEKSRLYVGVSCYGAPLTSEIFEFNWADESWKDLTRRFDIVAIDSPPLTSSPDGLAIAPKVDGVVLIVEADKTRWTVADSVKEQISKVGGKVLGIIFNKRQYYIPKNIYKRL